MPQGYVKKQKVRYVKKTPKKATKKRLPMVLPKEKIIKSNWRGTSTLSLATGVANNGLFNCMSCAPITAAISSIAAGDDLITGIPEYSNFYGIYTPLKVKLSITVTNINATNPLRMCIIPRKTINTLSADLAILNAYTFNELMDLQGCVFRSVGSGTGGASTQKITMSRTTKFMMDVGDVRDESLFRFLMPNITSVSGISIGNVRQDSWFYYFRVVNEGSTTNSPIQVQYDMSYEILLRNQKFIVGKDATA